VFLKSYDALGAHSSAAYAVAIEESGNPADGDGYSDQEDAHLSLFGGLPGQKWIRCRLPHDNPLRIVLFFSADGFLTGWSTTLNGTTCTNMDPCVTPQ